MADTILKGYVDIWGKHGAVVADHTGPASYVTGGETIGVNSLVGVNRYGLRSYDWVEAMDLSLSGNYFVRIQPSGTGSRTTFIMQWWVLSSGLQVSPGTNLTGETVRLLLVGG